MFTLWKQHFKVAPYWLVRDSAGTPYFSFCQTAHDFKILVVKVEVVRPSLNRWCYQKNALSTLVQFLRVKEAHQPHVICVDQKLSSKSHQRLSKFLSKFLNAVFTYIKKKKKVGHFQFDINLEFVQHHCKTSLQSSFHRMKFFHISL